MYLCVIRVSVILCAHVQTFFSNLEQTTTANKALVKRGLQFRDNLVKRFNWDFSQEAGEYAPTVVGQEEYTPTVVEQDEYAPTVVEQEEYTPTVVEQDEYAPTVVEQDTCTPTALL